MGTLWELVRNTKSWFIFRVGIFEGETQVAGVTSPSVLCSPAGHITSPEGFHKTVDTQAPPQSYGTRTCILSRSPGDLHAHETLMSIIQMIRREERQQKQAGETHNSSIRVNKVCSLRQQIHGQHMVSKFVLSQVVTQIQDCLSPCPKQQPLTLCLIYLDNWLSMDFEP
jgi:hypothetical protein